MGCCRRFSDSSPGQEKLLTMERVPIIAETTNPVNDDALGLVGLASRPQLAEPQVLEKVEIETMRRRARVPAHA